MGFNKFLLLSVLLLFLPVMAFAAMAPPLLALNAETMECAEFFMGDECVFCDLPPGWASIGEVGEITCPSDHVFLAEAPNSVCVPAKTPFCCSVNHSGAGGDCEDVVVNYSLQKCAFVYDIDSCESLPAGWTRAEVSPEWG